MSVLTPAPLLEMAGTNFTIRWPTSTDMLRMGLMFRSGPKGSCQTWAVFLHVLGGLPMPAAKRMALAHPVLVAAVFAEAFRRMLDAMAEDDFRRDDQFVKAITSGGAPCRS